MNIKRIIKYLKDIKVNNNRDWFLEHHDEYIYCKSEFERDVTEAINRIAVFDASVAHLTIKDCTYRFHRDTRFSPDKSPYKTHFGAYIAAHGKKAMHGGYYIHIEPGNCLLSCGTYWLPTNVLTSCRNELMANMKQWREYVENEKFINMFGCAGETTANDRNGFGLASLKTCPKGFPRDYPYMDYLRMKDYCCWHGVDDFFFEGNSWFDAMADVLKVGKPMMDFINSVVDDYE